MHGAQMQKNGQVGTFHVQFQDLSIFFDLSPLTCIYMQRACRTKPPTPHIACHTISPKNQVSNGWLSVWDRGASGFSCLQLGMHRHWKKESAPFSIIIIIIWSNGSSFTFFSFFSSPIFYILFFFLVLAVWKNKYFNDGQACSRSNIHVF